MIDNRGGQVVQYIDTVLTDDDYLTLLSVADVARIPGMGKVSTALLHLRRDIDSEPVADWPLMQKG